MKPEPHYVLSRNVFYRNTREWMVTTTGQNITLDVFAPVLTLEQADDLINTLTNARNHARTHQSP
jgi:hypothetical protein